MMMIQEAYIKVFSIYQYIPYSEKITPIFNQCTQALSKQFSQRPILATVSLVTFGALVGGLFFKRTVVKTKIVMQEKIVEKIVKVQNKDVLNKNAVLEKENKKLLQQIKALKQLQIQKPPLSESEKDSKIKKLEEQIIFNQFTKKIHNNIDKMSDKFKSESQFYTAEFEKTKSEALLGQNTELDKKNQALRGIVVRVMLAHVKTIFILRRRRAADSDIDLTSDANKEIEAFKSLAPSFPEGWESKTLETLVNYFGNLPKIKSEAIKKCKKARMFPSTQDNHIFKNIFELSIGFIDAVNEIFQGYNLKLIEKIALDAYNRIPTAEREPWMIKAAKDLIS